MIFQQFYLESLGHASYFIASEQTGEALVLDVRRDVDVYFEAARRHGMRIAYACDTHQHNDYLSGICELPLRGEVQLLAAARAELGYPVRRLDDGERFEMGEVVIEILHTPGHTPEHIALLVTDRSRSEVPLALFSGGALLVGDVGRPDLLGDAQQTRAHAAQLCRALAEKILTLPDHVQVYPTHVAGSLCASHIASQLHSTIGYERIANPALQRLRSADAFVDQCVDTRQLPSVPPYWRRMRSANQRGAAPLGTVAQVPPLTVAAFEAQRQAGAFVLDCRAPEAFGLHIPGALNVGFGRQFTTWAGTVLPEAVAPLLVVDHSDEIDEIVLSLLRIGYPPPRGYLAGGMATWRTAGMMLEHLPLWTVRDLSEELRSNPDLLVLDVRHGGEWRAGHIRGARHIPGAELARRMEEVPRDLPVAVVCSSGYRSGVAASVLKRHGYRRVVNVIGGMDAWRRAGFDVTDIG